MILNKALITAAMLVLGAPVVPALAHDMVTVIAGMISFTTNCLTPTNALMKKVLRAALSTAPIIVAFGTCTMNITTTILALGITIIRDRAIGATAGGDTDARKDRHGDYNADGLARPNLLFSVGDLP